MYLLCNRAFVILRWYLLLWLRCIINMRLFTSFYSSLIPHYFLSLWSPSSSASVRTGSCVSVVVPDVVFPLLFQHWSTSTFQPLTCVLILSSHQASLPGKKNLFDATSLDICRFLVFKDSKGKTQVHKTGCPHLGQRGIFSCQCP